MSRQSDSEATTSLTAASSPMVRVTRAEVSSPSTISTTPMSSALAEQQRQFQMQVELQRQIQQKKRPRMKEGLQRIGGAKVPLQPRRQLQPQKQQEKKQPSRPPPPPRKERAKRICEAASLVLSWPYNPRFATEFTNVREIATGSTATTYLVRRNSDQRLMVAKIMFDDFRWAENELLVLEYLSSNTDCLRSGVICHLGHFLVDDPRDLSKRVPLILTDFVDGTEMFDYTKQWWAQHESAPPSLTVRSLLRSCLVALKLLHSLGIAHRDIKPENIMVLSDIQQCVLIDFAFACIKERCKGAKFAGTPCFISFERYKHFFSHASTDVRTAIREEQAGDMWALGLVFFELMSGERNWPCVIGTALEESRVPTQFQLQALGKFTQAYRLLDHEQLSKDDPVLNSVMRGLIEPEMEYRLTAAEALAELDQPPQQQQEESVRRSGTSSLLSHQPSI